MINVITGRQVDNLQNEIIDQAVRSYYQDKTHDVFIIVPNHIKFTTEVRALSKLSVLTNKKQVAVNKLHILSFSRLAWYFLKDEAIRLPQILDDAASVMLLEQIVTDYQDELKLFQNKTQITSGALKQMYEAILSVRAGNIELDNIDNEKLNEETRYKIHDLQIVYDEFIERLSEKFATKDEMQLLLNEFLAKSNNLSKMDFYFSDFSHFSLQELTSVRLISKKANSTTLAFKTKIGKINTNAEPGDYDYVVQRTIKQLEHFWQNQELDYQCQEFPLSSSSPSSLLNGIWTKTGNFDEQVSKFLQPVKADSRYAEAYFVARTIYQQVALNNYRYQDFLVLAPNLSEYETYLTPILRQNNIPFFNDLQKEMKYHPLVVAVENLQQIFNRGFQTDNVIALMKTQLFIPEWYKSSARFQNDVDLLENFVLAHGIKGTLWTKPLKNFVDANVIALDKSEQEVEELDHLRKYFVDILSTFFKNLEDEKDPQTAVTIFWNFLIKNRVAKRLEAWRKEANDAGDLQLAQQPEQVWSTLNDLLKDYLLVAKEFSLDQFFELLISGFSEANFSQIPSTLDAVNISELGMVQGQDYKQVFIIGATSSNLPQIEKIPGFFSSENLEQLNDGINASGYLEDQQKINNLDQNYQFGNALSLASDKIYISYPVINTANEQLEPSIFYRQLLRLTKAEEFAQHDLPTNSDDVLTFMTNPEASLGYLTYLKGKEDVNVDSLLDLTEKKIGKVTQNVVEGSNFKNVPEDLSPELAQELYGNRIETSVSQLETYYQNSFEYFLNYGLHLKKRFENELDVIQAGNYYHETFDYLVKKIKEKDLNFADLTEEKLAELLIEVREELKEKGRYRQLLNDPFNKYLFHKLDQTTSNVAYYWHSNANKTAFRPQYT
uniref:PD-(D/E)XK nuclease family protein n=1 Tax=Lactobacillus taiwanensis TaxID=508451 RepID=UPI002557C9F8